MAFRALLAATAAVALFAGGAAAQTGSVSSGGSTAGGVSSGGATTGTGTGTFTGAAPTQLVPQGGVGSGDVQRSLSGLPQQGGSALDAAGSAVTEFGSQPGPVATTPSPMNAPSAFSDTGTTAVLTPTPLNAPAFRSTPVPPLSGTTVPAFGGTSGRGISVQGLEAGALDQFGRSGGGFIRSDGQVLSARQAAELQRELRAQQQAGAQVLILSGSVFQGTTDRPNVVVSPTGFAAARQGRGLTQQTLRRGQPVLQGTVEAPRVIALAPAPGNVLVVQGSQTGVTSNGTGQVRAQIVELPAE
jgi:hypothetical protein